MLGVKLSADDTHETTTVIPPKNDDGKVVTGESHHVTLTIFLILTCFAGLAAGIFYVIKSPVRRHRVLGLFRRNTGSVLYTRVSFSCQIAFPILS